MNAPNQALTIELKRTALLLLSAFPRLFLCECVHLIVKKMLEVGRKKKKRKRKQTNSIARIRARTSPPVVSFKRLKLPHAAKKTIQDIISRSRDPPSETKLTSHAVSKANKGKKKE